MRTPGTMRYVAFFLAFSAVAAGGCGGADAPDGPAEFDPQQYGALPGLRMTPHRKLQDELARIIEERGTPELLARREIAQGDNVAAGLADLFPPQQVVSILQASEEILSPKGFRFDPIRLQKAIDFRKKYEAQRLRARQALGRPQCDFGIPFMAGFLAELDFVEPVRICARLEAFRAAEALDSEHGLHRAVESLRYMLRLASCLGQEKHVTTRLEAAFLRTEAFAVLQAIVADEAIDRRELQRLEEMVRAHLEDWPEDAHAWIGDRALGLHAYEMVRDGRLLELLTQEEIEQFTEEGILEELTAACRRGVDHDELYYLEAMRRIIESCSQPYHARVPVFDAIQRELQERQNSPQYPVVAARLLLPDIRKGHAIQAQDRANWEAWALVLALATRRRTPAYAVNPLTGQKYVQKKVHEHVLVGNFGSGEEGDRPTLMVPDLAGRR